MKEQLGKQAEWNKEVCGMSECAAAGAAAHNPQMERKENFSSINQHKPTHSLVCGLMKRKLKKEEERRDCGLPLL